MYNPHQHNMIRARDLYSLLMFLINKNIKDAYIAVSLEKQAMTGLCKCHLFLELNKSLKIKF